MYPEIITRSIHFIAIMVLYGALLSVHLQTRKELPRLIIKRIAMIDRIAGIAAVAVLIVGLILWFGVGKPAEYYTKNGLMHVKLTLFIAAIGIGIYPSLFWLRQRRGDDDELVQVPTAIKALQGMQLLILLVMPVLATLIARGIGLRE